MAELVEAITYTQTMGEHLFVGGTSPPRFGPSVVKPTYRPRRLGIEQRFPTGINVELGIRTPISDVSWRLPSESRRRMLAADASCAK